MSNVECADMNLVSRLTTAVRRKGCLQVLAEAPQYIQDRYEEFQNRWYSERAHKSNLQFDLRYGVETSLVVPVENLDVFCKEHVSRYQPINEKLFHQSFARLQIDHSQYAFIDYGSGKGKALILASMFPFRKIIGIEFSSALCSICEHNLGVLCSRKQQRERFEVICADARDYVLPAEPMVLFFYNPFRDVLMEAVILDITDSLRANPRPAWIVYCVPVHAHYLERSGCFDRVDSTKQFSLYKAKRQDCNG